MESLTSRCQAQQTLSMGSRDLLSSTSRSRAFLFSISSKTSQTLSSTASSVIVIQALLVVVQKGYKTNNSLTASIGILMRPYKTLQVTTTTSITPRTLPIGLKEPPIFPREVSHLRLKDHRDVKVRITSSTYSRQRLSNWRLWINMLLVEWYWMVRDHSNSSNNLLY